MTGAEIYLQTEKGGQFRFEKGPVFANLVLADEINRAPAKVQSALLEAMEEHQVTVAGKTYKLPGLFMVLATENPIEQEGTYPLPEAQLDRFLMQLEITYPDEATGRFATILDCAPVRQDGASVFRLARGTVSIVEKGEAPLVPFFGAFTVSVRDEATLRRVLDAGRVSYRREAGALAVPREEAGGITLRFRPIA